jgi:tRNA A37 threonylcarbamoyladenosine dehydratase
MHAPEPNSLQQTEIEDLDGRRLAGVSRLYGEESFVKFSKSHVVVVGIGGVGSWAAEALVRSALGQITLIDFDHIALSNTNRQLHALEGEYGKSKVHAMAERLRKINPQIKINIVDDFLTPENMDQVLPKGAAILDATDALASKIALIVWAKKHKVPLVVSGAAGGKIDPTRIQSDDLSKTHQDPLLSKIRAKLRKEYGFEKDPKKKMRVHVVYSDEPRHGVAQGGLACSGYGSAVTVTGSFGFAAAAQILKLL